MGSLILLVAASSALCWIGVLAGLVRSNPLFIIVPLAATIVLTPKSGPAPIATVAGIAVLPIDIIITVSLAVSVSKWAYVRDNLGHRRTNLLLSAIILVSIQTALGFSHYGTPATLDARSLIAFIAITIYATTMDGEPTRKLATQFLTGTGAALIILEAWNIATSGFGSASEMIIQSGGAQVTSRPLVSDQAAVMGAAAFVSLYRWAQERSRLTGALGVMFTCGTIVAQHRSVWIALGVGFVILVKNASRSRLALGVAVICWILTLLSPALASGAVTENIQSSLAKSVDTFSFSTGTGGDRTESAKFLIAAQFEKGVPSVLLGSPYGSGYVRSLGRVESYQPHNAYVQTFMRVGIIGLIVILSLLVAAARGNLPAGQSGRELLPAVGFLIAYSAAYPFPWQLALVLGASLVKGRRVDEPSGPERSGQAGPSVVMVPPGDRYLSAPAST